MAFLSTLRLAGVLSLLTLQALGLVLHEQITAVPHGWSVASTPSASSQMVLQIALAQQNIDQLDSKLMAVSTPGSPDYGKYLDADAVNALFAPSKASADAVTAWLKASGVQHYTTKGDSIWFQTSVANANKMLGTTFHTYIDPTGSSKLRTTSYSLPASLSSHVDLISPTTYFGKTKAMRAIHSQSDTVMHELAARQVPAICNGTLAYAGRNFAVFGPACLKQIYKIGNYTALATSGSRIGFGSFLNQTASYADLDLFQKNYGITPQTLTAEIINGGPNPQPPSVANSGEANLDAQYQVGIGHPLPVKEYLTGGSPPYFPDPVEPVGTPNENEPYLPYYEYLLSKTNAQLPQVISNSYGDEEQTVPKNYAVRVCNLIGLLGLRGISVLESSGDEGVGAGCLALDGKTPQFNPIFPATCPYVTSVGGTVSFNPEIAWTGSSGGFSGYFARPSYQNAAIKTYLNEFVSPSTKAYYGQYTNFSGRGFPDIAAHSVSPDYTVYSGGQQTPSGGTSAAAPVTAAIIGLLNDARLRKGKPVLGFLNPLIYAGGFVGFTDVKFGSSNGCDGNNTQTGGGVPGAGVIPGSHWNATPGWDTVTGFGVPNFQNLLKLSLA